VTSTTHSEAEAHVACCHSHPPRAHRHTRPERLTGPARTRFRRHTFLDLYDLCVEHVGLAGREHQPLYKYKSTSRSGIVSGIDRELNRGARQRGGRRELDLLADILLTFLMASWKRNGRVCVPISSASLNPLVCASQHGAA
jgi:hypothetical protein